VKRILREDPGVRSAILAWAVRGCLEWQRKGLAPPAAILQATGDYREECDSIGDFIAECCALEPQARAGASELFKAYKQWCEANGDRPMSQKAFGRRLTDRGFTRQRGSGGRFYREGIRVSEPCERSEPDGDVFSHAGACGEMSPGGSDRSNGSLDSEAEERAGILEFEAGLDRVEAESRVR
jgi:phage/plasmid-associated DNA primase